jgi:hypothetical protein
LKSLSFFEKIIFNSNQIKQRIYNEFREGDNIYNGGGHAMRAMSRPFAENLEWPNDTLEDSFAYLRLKELGLKMIRQAKAQTYMRNTATLPDRLKQSKKYKSGKENLVRHFSAETIKKEHQIPAVLVVKSTFIHFTKEPFWTMLSVLEFCLNALLSQKKSQYSPIHEIYKSSKHLGGTS